MIVWHDFGTEAFGDVRYQVYDVEGAAVFEDFATVGGARGQSEPAVTGTADGGFVIAWTDQTVPRPACPTTRARS